MILRAYAENCKFYKHKRQKRRTYFRTVDRFLLFHARSLKLGFFFFFINRTNL